MQLGVQYSIFRRGKTKSPNESQLLVHECENACKLHLVRFAARLSQCLVIQRPNYPDTQNLPIPFLINESVTNWPQSVTAVWVSWLCLKSRSTVGPMKEIALQTKCLQTTRCDIICEIHEGVFSPLIRIFAFQTGVLVHEIAASNSRSRSFCLKENLTRTFRMKLDLCLNRKTRIWYPNTAAVLTARHLIYSRNK